MEHQLKWFPGRPGRGLVDKDGSIHTWAVFGPDNAPDHTVYQDRNKVNGHFYFRIGPDGSVDNDQGYLNQFRTKSDADILHHITEADPNLHPAVTDQWMFEGSVDGIAMTASADESAPYSDELAEWLKSLEPAQEEELSPHHHSPLDFLPVAVSATIDSIIRYAPTSALVGYLEHRGDINDEEYGGEEGVYLRGMAEAGIGATEDDPIVLGINQDGRASIYDGNHRLILAHEVNPNQEVPYVVRNVDDSSHPGFPYDGSLG